MSKLLENKEIIHIVSEVIAMIGITAYFYQKNKNMQEHIEELSSKILEQESIISKNTQTIEKIAIDVNTIQQYIIQQQNQQQNQQQFQQFQQKNQINSPKEKQLKQKKQTQNFIKLKTEKKNPIIISAKIQNKPLFSKDKVVDVTNEDDKTNQLNETNESDLDNEIVDELEDLQ